MSPGEKGTASWLPRPASHSAPGRPGCNPVRETPAGWPHPPCPSESINPMLFHKSNWHQASDSPTHRPAHPFPWKQPDPHERGPKRRDTGANTPEGRRGPVRGRVDLRLPGSHGRLPCLSFCISPLTLTTFPQQRRMKPIIEQMML